MNIAERKPMSLKEGHVYLDGEEIIDSLTCTINFSPEVAEHRRLNQQSKSRRWLGFDITGTMSQYKSTPFFKNAIKGYLNTNVTPVFAITGVQDDPASDYGESYGKDLVTLTGVVITSEIPLIQLDSDGELVTEEIDFGASDIVL